jgi:hypothetical protein
MWILMQFGILVAGILLTWAYVWVIRAVYNWVTKN